MEATQELARVLGEGLKKESRSRSTQREAAQKQPALHRPQSDSASALRRRIVPYYFLNTSFSASRWPVSNVPVADTLICCPSAETTHLSF